MAVAEGAESALAVMFAAMRRLGRVELLHGPARPPGRTGTGALLGVDRTTVSDAATRIRQLLGGHDIPLPAAAPPPGIRLRTTADLRAYASAAGIARTEPETGPNAPEHTELGKPLTATRPNSEQTKPCRS